MNKSNSFIAAKLAEKKEETVTVTPKSPVKRTRPAPYESRVVILRKRADGTVEEKNAAPAFLRQDRKSLVERVILPTDYYWRVRLILSPDGRNWRKRREPDGSRFRRQKKTGEGTPQSLSLSSNVGPKVPGEACPGPLR